MRFGCLIVRAPAPAGREHTTRKTLSYSSKTGVAGTQSRSSGKAQCSDRTAAGRPALACHAAAICSQCWQARLRERLAERQATAESRIINRQMYRIRPILHVECQRHQDPVLASSQAVGKAGMPEWSPMMQRAYASQPYALRGA